MATKQNLGSQAPDGSTYVVLTDGAGNLGTVTATSTENLAQIAGTAVDVNTGNASAGTQRVVLATNQPSVTIAASPPSTGTQTSVASSATDVTVLAANASRKGAAIYNDSTQVLSVLIGAGTSSATVYTTKIAPSGYYELAMCQNGTVYTGIIKGIWASANGNARVTEWT